MAAPIWTTALPDWEERIIAGQSLLPCGALFPAEAEAGLDIFRNLRIVDAPGRPAIGEVSRPWFFDLPTALFGSLDYHGGGQRLIREYFQLVSKKNGKSTQAPAIMLTALIRNWREQGEFYILAPTREVADNSFGPAAAMVRADKELDALIHISTHNRILTHRGTGAFLKVIAADSQTVSGKKTIGLLVEELHEFGGRADAGQMIREAKGGLASRPEGFMISISTQSSKPPRGIFEETLQEYRDIRDGKIEAPEKLPLLYEYPQRMLKAKDYAKPAFFYVTNPNLGLSVSEKYLLDEHRAAQRKSKADLADFYAKHLNVQIGQALGADGWAGAEIWGRGLEDGLTLQAVLDRSEVITVGIDGGGLDDLLGIAVIGRERGTKRWLCWAHALVSTIGLTRRKGNAQDYLEFVRDGDLNVFRFAGEFAATESEDAPDIDTSDLPDELLAGVLESPDEPDAMPADVQYVVELVEVIRATGLLSEVGVDAAGIGAIVDALDGIGVTQDAEMLGAVRQGIGLMGAIKTVERKLADKTFRHCGSRLLSWAAGNARVVATPTAMRIDRAESGFGKIDPLMAVFNAAALMAMNPEPAAGGPSAYETRELLVV